MKGKRKETRQTVGMDQSLRGKAAHRRKVLHSPLTRRMNTSAACAGASSNAALQRRPLAGVRCKRLLADSNRRHDLNAEYAPAAASAIAASPAAAAYQALTSPTPTR